MRDQRFQALAAAPKIVERLVRVLPNDRLDDRLHSESFTPREVIALLADTEQVVLDRLRMAVNKPGSEIPWYDPTERARDHHYGDKNVFHEAEVYESRRSTTMEFLEELKEEDFKKSFTLSGRGNLSVEDYLVLVMAHDLERIGQVTEILATEVASIA